MSSHLAVITTQSIVICYIHPNWLREGSAGVCGPRTGHYGRFLDRVGDGTNLAARVLLGRLREHKVLKENAHLVD